MGIMLVCYTFPFYIIILIFDIYTFNCNAHTNKNTLQTSRACFNILMLLTFFCFRGGSRTSRLEFLHTSGSINGSFGAGKERMALGADFHLNRLFRRADDKLRPACAGRFGFRIVFRVDFGFHDVATLPNPPFFGKKKPALFHAGLPLKRLLWRLPSLVEGQKGMGHRNHPAERLLQPVELMLHL